ncbi:Hypothetical predicted protein [Mytilus galloprovincialis]|uniref:ADAMTS cysteine-rich domain-containing protein n=1 Tax=Mytilus galloprovincialis TaxID=29158 RepID=A0A8B6C8Z9_MYTGA|nr:Hypothetical predicted protein [Mytilus galloprovincialis]
MNVPVVVNVFSLSAMLDGDGNSCNGTDAYIISYSNSPQQDPNKATNPWKISTCSIDNFTLKIDALESSGNNCMKTLGANFDPTALTPYNQSLAGQFNDADALCVHIFGTSSYMCRGQYNGNYESICSVLWCLNQEKTFCRSAIAGSGTLCGNHKWCASGVCISDINDPAGNELTTVVFITSQADDIQSTLQATDNSVQEDSRSNTCLKNVQ